MRHVTAVGVRHDPRRGRERSFLEHAITDPSLMKALRGREAEGTSTPSLIHDRVMPAFA
jgi:hypothetical protein